jgi:hypothetical protein
VRSASAGAWSAAWGGRFRPEKTNCGIVLAAYLHRRIKPQVRAVAIEVRFKCTRCVENGWAQWKIERAIDDRR